ncbi:trimeric LpxA-like protein [Peziza echinospora]|nr:trimeric LpxA-like protein [Peziza echinospora]
MAALPTSDASAVETNPPADAPQPTEKERMLRGELYYAFDPTLNKERAHAAAACHAFNSAPPDLSRRGRLELQNKQVNPIILGLPPLPPVGPDFDEARLDDEYPWILPPFVSDYGYNTRIAAGSFINFNATFLDTCPITIGTRVLVGPNVSFYAATHPIDPRVRNGCNGPELGKPIVVEDDVWIGGGAIICPGVTIGKGSTVGAGSVVTKACSISFQIYPPNYFL